MSNVCIVGAGIHPFGRHDGKTGLDLGVFAIREALSDARLDWTDMQFGFGGSYDSGDADAVSAGARAHRHAVHQCRQRLRHRRFGAAVGLLGDQSGESELGLAVGFDKHPRGAFNAAPKHPACRAGMDRPA